uniref:dihydrofolate reductase n=1 Tax=viral metagenome TaxID=1070528 RepID=A0A6C0C3T4_9ZZZZ
MNVIVAYCKNRGIGLNNKLPWKLGADMKRFKELTMGDGNNAVIMGRNTWLSLPGKYKPLPKRQNIVLTRKPFAPCVMEDKSLPVFISSLQESVRYCNYQKIDKIWIIGGQMLYKTALETSNIENIYVTNIEGDYNCDTFFPEIPSSFYLKSETEMLSENNINYKFEKYVFRNS